MAVHHNSAELVAHTGDPTALEMFKRDERVIGLQRNDKRGTLRKLISQIEAAAENGSNWWHGEIAYYATINTSVLGLAIKNATKVSLAMQVREPLHRVCGENPMYVAHLF